MIGLYFAQGLSAAVGFNSAVYAVIIWTLLMTLGRWPIQFQKFNVRSAVLLLALLLSAIYSSLRFGSDAIFKQFGSLIIIFCALVLFKSFYVRSSDRQPQFQKLGLMGGLLLPASIGLIEVSAENNRGYFPYGEAAAFSLFVSPFAIFLSFQRRRVGIFAIAVVGTVGILTPNLTSIICFAYGLFCIILVANLERVWKIWAIICFLAACVLIYYVNELTYFTERTSLSIESDNLSVLVYQHGFRSAWDTLRSGEIFGYGAQTMGIYSPWTSYLERLADLMENSVGLNIHDGGIVFGKLVTEMGVLGLIFVSVVCATVLRLLIVSFLTRGYYSPSVHNFLICFVLFLPIHIFVRGLGYFFLPFFVGLLAILVVKMKWTTVEKSLLGHD